MGYREGNDDRDKQNRDELTPLQAVIVNLASQSISSGHKNWNFSQITSTICLSSQDFVSYNVPFSEFDS